MLLQWLNNIGYSKCNVYYGIIEDWQDKPYFNKLLLRSPDLFDLVYRELVDIKPRKYPRKPIVIRNRFKEYIENRESSWIKEMDEIRKRGNDDQGEW